MVTKIMSYPSTSYNDKYMDLNTSDYAHPSNAHMRPPILHQENVFRWPHTTAPTVDRTPIHNHTSYFQEKTTPPRIDYRYNDIRYPHDTRTRHNAVAMLQHNEQQQRFHDFHMQQLQKNNAQSLNDVRFSMADNRPPFMKKPTLEPHAHDVRASFDEGHSPHVNLSRPNFTPSIDARHAINSNPYSFSTQTNTKLFSESRPVLAPDPPLVSTTVSATSVPPMQRSSPLPSTIQAEKLPTTMSIEKNMLPCVKSELSVVSKDKITDKFSSLPEKSSKECPKTEKSLAEDEMKNEKPQTIEDAEKTTKELLIHDLKKEKTTDIEKGSTSSNEKKKSPDSPDNGLPSYTAMIAQAILKKEGSKSTLSDIYEYMEKHFSSLERRGTGWRNCVRHTLSLNDCFIKLHRPENGRSCNWAVHPTYFESFSRGDYRKRRALRKRPRGLQWIDPIMLGGYPFAREHEVPPEIDQQQSPFYHYPPPAPGMWTSQQPSYANPNIGQMSPGHLHHFPQPPPPGMHPIYPGHPSHHAHLQNNHCANPDCYCQYNKNNYRVYTP